MNVVFLSPSYPPEMREYTRGLAEVGARVWGVGDGPPDPRIRPYLDDYLQVPRILDEEDVIRRVHEWLRGREVDRIEGIWEVLTLTAAKLRDRLGVPGMSADTVLGFRDKQLMKERVQAAGLRVPYAFRVRGEAEIRAAAERVGFPLILKPIAGAGSADTYRVDGPSDLERVLPRVAHVRELSCEEFVDGEEFTFDTLCIEGRPAFINVAQYLPRPLIARTEEWITPVIVTVRDLQQPKLRGGLQLGLGVLKALRMGTGFTHMEWYLKSNGEVVFGEIGCRPGGAHLVDQMNYTCDTDLFREWARAVCWHTVQGRTERLYNVAILFKRARGHGRITSVTGLDSFKARYGRWICTEALLPVGTHRRDWKQTLLSDGHIILRHPDWSEALRMAHEAAETIVMTAE